MEVTAKLTFARVSAQKCRLVCDQVRGKSAEDALAFLSYNLKKSSSMVKKLLNSAIANAEHNHGADIDDLRVAEVQVNEGPTLKRLHPRAKGRANRISKRTCHVSIKLTD